MSIYDTIGGDNLVAEAVEKFYTRLKSDPIIGVFSSTPTWRGSRPFNGCS